MSIKDLEKYILSKEYTKKRVIKKFQQVRFTALDFPIVIITLSSNNEIFLKISADYKNILQQRTDYPKSVSFDLKTDANKWNDFNFNNTIPDNYILAAIDISYNFAMSKVSTTYQKN